MAFAIVWFVVLAFIAQFFPCFDFVFWLATWFIPPLVLFPLLGGCS
jgi:hypothetical protein